MTEAAWRRDLEAMGEENGWEHWAVQDRAGNLGGSITLMTTPEGAFLHRFDLTAPALDECAAYSAVHALTARWCDELALPISNGARSISHETAMQDFLSKFGFQREYSRLAIIYRPPLGFFVTLLFPCRRLLSFLPGSLPGIRMIRALLHQEALHRGIEESRP